jgi:DNA-binding LytR/AlgR family response regulator
MEAANLLASNNEIDLIFLDIELGDKGLNGLDILKTIPQLPPVIINTSHPDFAVESYRIGKAADYLVKPFDYDRFLIAVNRALNVGIGNENLTFKDFIVLKKGRKFEKFDYKEVVYFEGYGIYAKVYTEEVIHVVNETITSLSEKLSPKWFVRVHKLFIVNIEKIKGFDHNYIYLGSVKVPIGLSYRENLAGLFEMFNKSK